MTAALGSRSVPLPSLPQPRPRAPRLILGSGPSRFEAASHLLPALQRPFPRLRIGAPTRSQVHDALNLLTDSSATWDARDARAMPPVASAPDGAGRDRDPHRDRTPHRQAVDRTGSSEALRRPPSVHDALNLLTDSSWAGDWHDSRELRERD